MADASDIKNLTYLIERTGVAPSGGEGNTAQEGDDLRSDVKDTVGKYLTKLTHDVRNGNEFPTSAGNQETSLRDASGQPAPLSPAGKGADRAFAGDESSAGLSGYSDNASFGSGGGKNETLGELSSLVKKGQQQSIDGALDGHTLLPSIGLPAGDAISKKISEILIKGNRFDPGPNTPFIASALSSPASVQAVLGTFNRNARSLSTEDLQKIGLSLMLRATGEFLDGDPDSVGATAPVIPGAAQLAATRIEAKSMYTQNAYGAPQRQNNVDTEASNLPAGRFGDVSYGALNSPYEPFDGFLPIGMTILAAALVIALKLVLELFVLLFSMMFGGDSSKTKDFSDTPLPLGSNSAQAQGSEGGLSSFGSVGSETIGLRATKYPFSEAFDRGVDAFFQFDGESFVRILSSPGFYAVFVRAVIRSGNTLANAIASIGGNPIDVAQGILGLVDVIKSSKIIALINVLTGLGDSVLQLESEGFEIDAGPFSTIDKLVPNVASHVMKSRETEGRVGLIWRNSSSRSQLLLPPEVLKADLAFNLRGGGKASIVNGMSKFIGGYKYTKKFEDIITNRFTPEQVEEIESELEAEYVPFYFHDLRTNEIVSFHAFLDALTDRFTPNYESTTGYGRVDPVRVYRNTERSITFSFHVVAVNENDFDHMWMKLNKFMTLLYPQWSPGRSVGDGTSIKFIQPFSQTLSASPLIRLRIGDVVKSNYSRFAIARLFGLGRDDFSVTGNKLFETFDGKKIFSEIGDAILAVSRDPSKTNDDNDGFVKGDVVTALPNLVGYKKGTPESDAPQAFRPLVRERGSIKNRKLITKQRVGMGSSSGSRASEMMYEVTFEKHPTVTYLVPHNSLQAIPDEVAKRVINQKTDINPDSDKLSKMLNFFRGEIAGKLNNSIIHSFKSIQGKGLAGFITSMDIDFITNTTWDTGRFGSRAPKNMKINVNFAPVHDIPPGLDDSGFNRAPIYNVGGLMNSVAGDVYDENGNAQEKFLKTYSKVKKKDKA